MSEHELVQNVKPLLEKEYKIYEEVKIFTRSIDLVLKDEYDKITSIEFKLNNWGKAYQQISDYQIVSDYCYLCIPQKQLQTKTIDKIKSKGIGLLVYDSMNNELEEVIKPLKSKTMISYYKNFLISKLTKENECLN